ncbi:unnamed protein product [Rhodiola kirilowii]
MDDSETNSSAIGDRPAVMNPNGVGNSTIVTGDDPYFVHSNELTGSSIVSKVLVGQENYATWKRSMEIALSGRYKLGFVEGKYPKPSDVVMAARWQRCNDVVMSWLINSVSEKIVGEILHAKDAATAWEILESSYAGTNLARQSELQRELGNLVQGDLSVAMYKRKLESLWQELDGLKVNKCPNTGKCPCCKKNDEDCKADRVIKFLMGLNDDYASVRTHVFAMSEVPKFSVVFGLALSEEASRKARHIGKVESSALAAQTDQVNSSQADSSHGGQSRQYSTSQTNQMRGRDAGRGSFGRGRPRLFCSHCQIPGHLKENCYKLIGYPQNYKQNRNFNNSSNSGGKSSANSAANTGSSDSSGESIAKQFTNEQLEQILALFKGNGLTDKTNAQVNMAHVHMAGIANSYPEFMINGDWLIDSGATSHFTYDANLLRNIHELKEIHRVTLPNGECFEIKSKGDCHLQNGIVLYNVLLVPEFQVNLISVYRLVSDSNFKVLFTDRNCIIQDHRERIILETGSPVGALYSTKQLKTAYNGDSANSLEVQPQIQEMEKWHNRLGHAPMDIVTQLLRNKIPSIHCKNLRYQCTICPLAKQTKLPFALSNHTTCAPFELLHSDVWGPFHVPTIANAQYFLTIIDDYTRAVWTFLMKCKSETTDIIIGMFHMVATQFGKAIKRFRSDNGGEFFNNKLTSFLQSKGCIHQSSCPYTPQQNGLAERKNRHILEVARALMFEAGLPKHFWGDSVLTATHIINRLPTPVLKGKSPWEMLFGEKPHVDHLRVFGCSCFVSTKVHTRDKFDPRALECIFLGYPAGQKGYKLFCLSTQQVLISRHVIFREHIFPFKRNSVQLNPSNSLSVSPMMIPDAGNLHFNDDELLAGTQTDDDQWFFDAENPDDPVFYDIQHADESDTVELPMTNPDISGTNTPATVELPMVTSDIFGTNAPVTVEVPQRKSTRVSKKPAWTKDYICNTVVSKSSPHLLQNFISYSKCAPHHAVFALQISSIQEPTSYTQASKDTQWVEAMNKEIKALEGNNTWVLTELPKDKTVVDCKWIYKIKYLADGSIERFKARLVARGFTQVEGLDYHETFAPVAKMTTVRCLLAIAAARNWPLHQLDVDNAFLHGTLEEEVYMKLPPGFYRKEKAAGKVCKLVKSLYGLKQASRQWFAKFSDSLIEFGFKSSLNDYSLFTLTKGDIFLILLVYVDDVIITGNSEELISEVKQFIHHKFKIKDLGHLKYFLGLEVARSTEGIFLNQRKYALELLEEHSLTDCKPAKTPIRLKHNLSMSTAPILNDQLQYRRLVGKLIYLTITRPDLAYPVHILSQFMQHPTEDHQSAALRLLRYVKAAPAQGILFPACSDLQLKAFCDADWAACPLTRRSITGHCVMLGPCVISWKTKKQPVVSRSSAESEYRSMAAVCCELTWLARLVSDMGIHVSSAIHLHCDNKAAIHIAHNPVFHERTKHVELDCHLVRSHVISKFILPLHISTNEQPADIFTKPLTREQLQYLCSKLGVSNFLHSAA